MDFASGGSEKAPAFTSIDEDEKFQGELEKRQKEWEKTRTAEVEANEGLPLDRRPLWMKLQEQKDKKQADWEEKYNPKSMVQGLEEEEAEFLGKVADYQDREKASREREEIKEITMYREAAVRTAYVDPESQLRSQLMNSAAAMVKKKQAKSQASMLAGLVKTKRRSGSTDGEPPCKAPRQSPGKDGESKELPSMSAGGAAAASTESKAAKPDAKPDAAKPPSGLSGLQAYSDDDDDSDE